MNKLIKYKDYNIKTIIQIGDIHFRLLRRHDEYKQVFDKFYLDLEKYNNKETLLVLTGDILHSKTEMSPELIQITSEFFTRLSNILPTVMIAGNHDGNISNPNRLDSLSPIIDNLNLPHFIYLKESGIYQFGNIDIAVYSIFDTSLRWPLIADCNINIKPNSNNHRNIALYHGPVTGAKTGTGFELKSDVNISLWNGFDAVLLGDIHTYNILQEYEEEELEIDESELKNYEKDGWKIIP